MTIVEAARGVTGGVDTHLDVHVAAALDPLGGLLGTERFETDAAGYKALLGWLELSATSPKSASRAPGSYGSGLARYLRRAGVEVLEVDRPDRQKRRRSGKSDPLDAVEAARAALGGRAKGISKSKDGAIEAIRVLVVAKRSARGARVKALTQMRHLVITAPDQLRARLKGLSVIALVNEAARLRPSRSGDAVMAAHKAACARWPGGSKGSKTSWPSSSGASGCSSDLPPQNCWLALESVLTLPPPSWSVRATTPSACIQKPPGPICAELPRSRPHRARATDTASIVVGIARPTARSGASSWSASPMTQTPPPTSSARSRRDDPSETSSASSSATSPASSTATCLAADSLGPWVWLIP